MKITCSLATELGPISLTWEESKLAMVETCGKREGTHRQNDLTPGQLRDLNRVQFCIAGHGDPGEIDWDGLLLTPFQRLVLTICRAIPLGRVASYATLAKLAGCPRGYRAAGSVMAANPLPLLIPCHRVVPTSRKLGNYGGGVDMKRILLAREGIKLDGQGRIGEQFFHS